MHDSLPRLVLIAAMAHDRVIGRDNQLAWHLPEDMAHFRRSTQGYPVLMGRKTWESLPERFRPLPGRRNVVLTRQAGYDAPGAEVVHTLAEALARFTPSDTVFVIGGAQIYAEALPHAQRLLLTELDVAVPGDAQFPAWPAADFREVSRETHHAAAPNDFDFAFVCYERMPPQP
ncbi:dihydrofolate reductase [Ideonella paludis]|uniref:Dihydrofolate reductase n=1 Tax=Ideonella paludis TaxID=1233411 RepID=A0ABS5DV67_9BURK|nr:dihydrofolate reductase [Ideonella paludis]MBQ0935048.1 dihydrofolate reductase [Ideonella paludis]